MSEISFDIVQKTQKSLGKYIKKPTLTEKLLNKPPFRFLHDIVKALIKDTGFLNGLFTEDELVYEKVKEKEAKIAFLTKLIDAVKFVSKAELKVRPSKIVAGLEATETNILLQTIAKCVDKKIDTTEYVSQIKAGAIAKEKVVKKSSQRVKEKKSDTKESSKEKKKVSDASGNKLKKPSVNETPKSTDRMKNSTRSKTKEQKSKKNTEVIVKKDENIKKEKVHSEDKENDIKMVVEEPIVEKVESNEKSEKVSEMEQKNNDESEEKIEEKKELLEKTIEQPVFSNARLGSAGLVRPKSARPKSGDRLMSTKEKIDMSPQILESSSIEIKSLTPATAKRPSSSLRPPSVRPSSARPGAPRLRPESALPANEPVAMGNIKVIIENIADEEDTVIIQNAPEEEDIEITSSELLNVPGDNKGQLVEQILEQIQEEGSKRKVEIDWEQDGLRGKDATTKEVTHLRTLIQTLTKTANPLGKLMNYLHEDLDAMHNELQMWTNTKKQLYVEIEKQRKLSMESSKPLVAKLEHLKQEIKKQEREILVVRSNILKNEHRIHELLTN